MSLQGHNLCKFPALYIIIINRMVACALKVAPIQRSVTTDFHPQSRRDSDCQMSELVEIQFLSKYVFKKLHTLLYSAYFYVYQKIMVPSFTTTLKTS